MLDAFAYPVSALMALWHDLLSTVLPPGSGAAWVGSILLLVGTIRLLLLRSSWTQLRTSRQLAALRPRLAALKEEHGQDQAAYLEAVRQLRRQEGVGAAGCLPLLAQVPVFLGLYHLLARFAAVDLPGSNGVFTADQVRSFAHATVFDVPLAAAVRSPATVLESLAPGLVTADVLVVALPLLLVAALATFGNGLLAARRQRATADDPDDPVALAMRRVTEVLVWVGPLGVLAGGLLYPVPVALLLYWAVNGTWTWVQTAVLHRCLDRSTGRAPLAPG